MTEITIPVDEPGPHAVTSMPATRYNPEGDDAGGAGIVLVQEIFGRSPYMRSRAEDLAKLGYTVVLPQVYWRIGVDNINEDTDGALEAAMGAMQQVDWPAAVADIRAAVTTLRRDPATGGRVALVGFCFGGGLAYAALQGAQGDERADALVSYYGSALPGLVDAEPVTVPSLHHFGDSDGFIDADAVAHIREVVTSNGADFHLWPGANHAFDNSTPNLPFHHPEASEQAWQVTIDWLAANFPA